MHLQHKKILEEIKKHKGKGTKHTKSDSYLLSGHTYYDVSVPLRRQIVKEWLRNNKEISDKEFIALLDSLYQGASHDEKTIASFLLGEHHVHRKKIKPKHLNMWLDHLVGWAEVDALCQNVFTAEELLSDWKTWEAALRKFSKNKNIHKRRASLVLLTGPVKRSADARFKDLSFELMDTLKHEKPILITKAISWLLREMTYQHKKEVSGYLKDNEDTLPKIALRETWRKIKTGRK